MAEQSIKRINPEDFPEQRSWIGKLLSPLNEALATLGRLVNRNLVIGQHVRAEIKTLSFTNDAVAFPITFRHTLPVRPQGVLVASAAEVSSVPAAFADAVYASWDLMPDGKVRILGISGLTADTKYNVTLLLF